MARVTTRRGVHAAQTEISVPNEIGRKHDPDEAYGRAFGEAKLAEQQRAFELERACNCHSAFAKRWGRAFHKPGCPRAGKRF